MQTPPFDYRRESRRPWSGGSIEGVLLAQVLPDRTPCIGPAASAIHRASESSHSWPLSFRYSPFSKTQLPVSATPESLGSRPSPRRRRLPLQSPALLPLLGDSTDLLHHAERVIVDPLFLDFVA